MKDTLGYDGGLTCALEVADINKAMAWYQDVMGFHLNYHLEEMAWCEFSTPVERVTIGLSQVEKPQPRGGATLTFGVKDIDVARKTLEDNAVRFDGDIETIPDMVRFATFFDPDGNTLMLYQDLSQQTP